MTIPMAALAQSTAPKASQPDASAAAKVVADAQRLGVTKIGFFGVVDAATGKLLPPPVLIKHGHVYTIGTAGTLSNGES